MIISQYAAESGHYYRLRDGAPFYEVVGKNGKPRATNVKDFKRLRGTPDEIVPSVTTIIKCAAAPGLDMWKQQQVLMAALTLPKVDGEDEKAYLARIMSDSKEQARKAADRGTAIHAAIQGHFETGAMHPDFAEHIKGACAVLSGIAPLKDWTVERAFSHPMGFGGKTDLFCDTALVDVKSKEFGPDNPPSGYDEHAMQLAAYCVGLGMDIPQMFFMNLFVSASHPGLCHAHYWDTKDIQRGWQMFCALLDFWKAKHVPIEIPIRTSPVLPTDRVTEAM